jgi:predicted RNA-binding Zn-ribbon protein involved in translation (DUF1610 family)
MHGLGKIKRMNIEAQEKWIARAIKVKCPQCSEEILIAPETMAMNGVFNCPFCGKEVKED